MELLLFLAGWYAVGLAGGAITLAWWWWRGLAITVDEVCFSVMWAVLGPITPMVGVALFLLEVPKAACRRIASLARRMGYDGDRVLIEGRRK